MEQHACDVCRLLEGDASLKDCHYCTLCDSWICPKDQNWLNPVVAGRRMAAALKRKLEPDYKGIPDYDTMLAKAAKKETAHE